MSRRRVVSIAVVAVGCLMILLGSAPRAGASARLGTLGTDSIAGDRYVDCFSGSDGRSGASRRAAWRTLAPVNARRFRPGDVIRLRRGCTFGPLRVRSDGTAERPITYRAYGPGPAPVIRDPGGGMYGTGVDVTGDYNVVEDLLVRDVGESGVNMRRGADHNVVRDIEVTGAGLGIASSGSDNHMTGNVVHDLRMVIDSPAADDDYGAVCFWIAGPGNEISENQGFDCRAPSDDYGFDGGFVEIWRQGDGTSIHHNLAVETNGFLEAGGSGSARDVNVYRNVLIEVHGGLCLHDRGGFAITVDNLRFEHNTFVSAGGYRVLDCASGLTLSTVIMRNNIFVSGVPIAGTGAFTHTHNLYRMDDGVPVGYALGAGELLGDPLFADLGHADLRLGPGSPAIDAGTVVDGPAAAGDDAPAGAAPDLGAFEYRADPAG